MKSQNDSPRCAYQQHMGNSRRAATRSRSKKSNVFLGCAAILVIVVAGYYIWKNPLQEPDTLTASARHSATAAELRQVLGSVNAPIRSQMVYHQAVDEENGEIAFMVSIPSEWHGQPIDLNKLTPEQFAAPLIPIAAIVKASAWEWKLLRYDVHVTRNHSDVTVLHAQFSSALLRGVNLSKVNGKSLVECADDHSLDPQYHWAAH